jgi:integrase
MGSGLALCRAIPPMRNHSAARPRSAGRSDRRLGEALGLKWSDIDLDTGSLRIRRGRLRPRYAHGHSLQRGALRLSLPFARLTPHLAP